MATPVALTSERASLLLCELEERTRKKQSHIKVGQEDAPSKSEYLLIPGAARYMETS